MGEMTRPSTRSSADLTLFLDFYVHEAERQGRYAALAWADLRKALSGRPRDHDRVWLAVEAFLGATANISRLLWPGQPRRQETPRDKILARKLREKLTVSENSPLRERSARD